MMRFTRIVATGLSLAACSGDRADTTPDTAAAAASPATSTELTDVDKAVAVERGIQAAPTKADSVLAAHGLTAAGFDSLMYRIASDSSMRAALATARR
jgi:hypothetical protein